MGTPNQALQKWVEEMTALTKPDHIVWLDGSEQEYKNLCAEAVKEKVLIPLNEKKNPGSFLHRSHPSDVARTEHCTFVCTHHKEDAGPNNNWMAPEEALTTLKKLFHGVMHSRKMYVIPFLLGPKNSRFSKVGVQLTDSIYVAINMYIMTRMGKPALDQLGNSEDFIKGMHSVGNLDPNHRYICHFPEEASIWSINSGYGGNALLSKKCAALRIASWVGKNEGWLAEHMLIMGVEDPQGRVTYIAGAFPSACGKTNLAMMRPRGKYEGYKIWCVGDDIAWMRIGADGRLYAANPEAGFFGVAPGTNAKSNPHMMKTISRNTLFTNVGMTADRTPWWEGLDLPDLLTGMVDWQGKPWDPDSGQKAAHPNARFTTPIKQCPVYSKEWENPEGVPISAILFGCRRSKTVPLIYESFSWQHGVYIGSTLQSETTAAAAGQVGTLRRDPMAMLPFAGYNMGDYFNHWLNVGKRMNRPPKIFRVNWFRTNDAGKFIWPGFGENIRVIKWVIDRVQGTGDAVETPLGYIPNPDHFDIEGLNLERSDIEHLFEIERDTWLESVGKQTEYFEKFGTRTPPELYHEQQAVAERLKNWEKTPHLA